MVQYSTWMIKNSSVMDKVSNMIFFLRGLVKWFIALDRTMKSRQQTHGNFPYLLAFTHAPSFSGSALDLSLRSPTLIAFLLRAYQRNNTRQSPSSWALQRNGNLKLDQSRSSNRIRTILLLNSLEALKIQQPRLILRDLKSQACDVN